MSRNGCRSTIFATLIGMIILVSLATLAIHIATPAHKVPHVICLMANDDNGYAAVLYVPTSPCVNVPGTIADYASQDRAWAPDCGTIRTRVACLPVCLATMGIPAGSHTIYTYMAPSAYAASVYMEENSVYYDGVQYRYVPAPEGYCSVVGTD